MRANKHTMIVSTVTVIQFRTEYIGDNGKTQGWNTKFQTPKLAASEWAGGMMRKWRADPNRSRKFGEYDDDYEQNLCAKFIRRSLPVFRRLLAGNNLPKRK